MEVQLVADAAEFLARAEPLLLRDEARHNLILGLAGTLRDHPSFYPEHRLWLVEDAGRPVAAALRTPPRGLVLARPENDAALAALAGGIEDEVPELVGALPEAHLFAEAWCARTGFTANTLRAQGIYALTTVRVPEGVLGEARLAGVDDAPLLVAWWRAFAIEALHEGEWDDDAIERQVRQRLETDGLGLAVWAQDGAPVSFAGFGGATPNGARIGPVYTPPAQRGRGYASALVASVSADMLAEGKRFCFLYTDLANPISNRIYERIGYERVCEAAHIAFTPAG